jgi:inosine-uridine nucleoside N-ribohydrolase
MAELIRLLIDTDGGIDDALALLLALRSPPVQVDAITTTFGNVDVDQAVRNVNYVLELCRVQIPVYRGAKRPLDGKVRQRRAVHGSDGLGDLGLRPKATAVEPEQAANELLRRVRGDPRRLTLVTLGPLTNLALALAKGSDFAELVQQVVVMGGAIGAGTVTARAEFNMWSDPEAAKAVLSAGLPLTLVPIDVSRDPVSFDPMDQAGLDETDSAAARFAISMMRAASKARARASSAELPDVIAAALAIDPALSTQSHRYYVDIETEGELTMGETVIDVLGLSGRPPNAEVAETIDAPRFKAMLFEACR